MKKIITFCAALFTAGFLFAQASAAKLLQATDTDELVDFDELKSSVQLAMSNPDYLVTAGDVYTLAYAAGSSAVTYPILVDSSYKIRVSNLAVIDASGKTYMSLKKQVEEIVTKNYPLSGVQFALTTPSSFKVTVKGEVTQTVERSAWALSRLSSVIKGSLTDYSSIRDVCITSSNGKIKTYDLFKAQREGDMSQDPYVRPGDVISVKKAERSVNVSGAVERPGKYQLLKNENLKSLIDYYGNGLVPMADTSRIELTRSIDDVNKSGKKLYLSQKDIDSDFELLSYDSVVISSYSALKPVVFIEGALQNSDSDHAAPEASNRIAVQFENNTNYAYFVRNYSHLFSSISDTENAYIIRGAEIIPVNLNEMLYNASFYSELTVQENDILRVPFKQYFVSVAGAVYSPGRYPYIPDRTYDYYVGLAGGFIKNQNARDKVTIVDLNGKELSKTDIITPECTITAASNAGLYKFNQIAPVLTAVLSVVGTTVSVMASMHVFD